jgi:hypothetical protein
MVTEVNGYVCFEVFIAMTVKIVVFWFVTPCSFAGRYILEAQAASIFSGQNQSSSGPQQVFLTGGKF